MDDSTEFSSQVIEEEDFFFDDDDDIEQEDNNDQEVATKQPVSNDKNESFRSLLAGPSTNKVF